MYHDACKPVADALALLHRHLNPRMTVAQRRWLRRELWRIANQLNKGGRP